MPRTKPRRLAAERSRCSTHGAAGQGLVEYGLILGLSTALAMVVLVFMGGTLGDVLDTIARAIDEAT
jgi:Flp pilus assembly pilin Flp